MLNCKNNKSSWNKDGAQQLPRSVLRSCQWGLHTRTHSLTYMNMTSDSRKLLRGKRHAVLQRNVVNCALKGAQHSEEEEEEKKIKAKKRVKQKKKPRHGKNGTAIVIQLEKRLSLLSIFWLLFFAFLSNFFVQKCQNIE